LKVLKLQQSYFGIGFQIFTLVNILKFEPFFYIP